MARRRDDETDQALRAARARARAEPGEATGATLTKVAGGTVNLPGPVYDAATDSLKLTIKSIDVPTDSWNFWDIVSITIGK